MSDEGEKTCPLCAEEMDLTDQQLKPCKCGYDVCVWCWHHIMDMAEKDNTEGRCPACRTPYNKEKIVGTSSKCERLVAEMNVEKKHKSQKGKTKTSEGRKQLSSVRVIQRNLVYIVGLPLNLADEDLLQRKEYFGQYGKVQKVSISRTAAGAIQHFANNTCSVYITYSKEDEAVRSIQAVHGFVLEGRPLRACFGTTKYCHAWLRSMPCTNPDCLYLHEFGSQEDSFTKDEIISEYTRGRVQQVTGAINETQRRSGNILPPPADDYSNNSTSSWGKPISKNTTNDPANSMKGSPPNSSPRRSVVLPAAASWGTRTSNSQPLSANLASPNGPSKQKADTYTTLTFSTTVASPSLHANEILKKGSDSSQESHTSAVKSEPNHTKMVPSFSKSSSNPVQENELDVSNEEIINNLSSEMSSLSTGSNQRLVSDLGNEVEEVGISKTEADLLSFNDQRLRDPEVVTHTSYAQNISSPRLNSSLDYSYSHRQPYASVNGSLDPPFSDQNSFNLPAVNGHSSNLVGNSLFETKRDHNTSLDLGENSIISNILSMDFDPWDESLTSPQNLAKLLGDSDKQEGSNRVSGSRKAQNSNQSRFSFAREDECVDQGLNFAPTFSDYGPGLNRSFSREFVSNRDVYPGQFSDGNGFSSFNFEESDRAHSSISSNKISAVSRTQVSAPPGFLGPSRAPPPGFTSHERMEHTYDNLSGNNHMFETSSLLRKVHQAPSPVYNNGSLSDLEFMDPAILAVGGRVNSNFPSFENNNNNLQLLVQRSFTQQNQRYTGRNDAYGVNSRIIEQTLPNNRSHYQQTSFQQPRSSMISSNGHWDGWNEVQNGNDIAMAEILRNERVGFNKYYSGYEDAKFRLSGSGDVYNRTFGL